MTSTEWPTISVTPVVATEHRIKNFGNVVMGGESRVFYVNRTRKASKEPAPTQSLPNLHQNRVTLCCWWGLKEVLHYEILETATSGTENICAAQLQRLSGTTQRKRSWRKNVYFLHDNARLHVAKMSCKSFGKVKWNSKRLARHGVICHGATSEHLKNMLKQSRNELFEKGEWRPKM